MRFEYRFFGATVLNFIFRSLFVLLICLKFGIFAASAQTNDNQTKSPVKRTSTSVTYGGWIVNCNEIEGKSDSSCSAVFRVIEARTRANLLVWLIGRDADGRSLIEFLTPTNILISPGVQINLDKQPPLFANYVSCTANGCKASMNLHGEVTETLRLTKQAAVSISGLDGKVTTFNMKIEGIGDALADLGM